MEKEDKYKEKMTLIRNQRQNLLFGLNKHEQRQVVDRILFMTRPGTCFAFTGGRIAPSK
jgi:hypothetical protein